MKRGAASEQIVWMYIKTATKIYFFICTGKSIYGRFMVWGAHAIVPKWCFILKMFVMRIGALLELAVPCMI